MRFTIGNGCLTKVGQGSPRSSDQPLSVIKARQNDSLDGGTGDSLVGPQAPLVPPTRWMATSVTAHRTRRRQLQVLVAYWRRHRASTPQCPRAVGSRSQVVIAEGGRTGTPSWAIRLYARFSLRPEMIPEPGRRQMGEGQCVALVGMSGLARKSAFTFSEMEQSLGSTACRSGCW
jgi:hypothetical protein